jgi:membrane protein
MLKQAGTRLWHAFNEDDLLGQAAKLAYYFLLSVVPFLIFLTAMLGLFARHGTALRANLLHYLNTLVPAAGSTLIHKLVEEIGVRTGTGKLSFGIATSLWAASSGMSAVMGALNVAYDVKETRPMWKTYLIALALTIGLSIAVIIALAFLLYGGVIAVWIERVRGLGPAYALAWRLCQWPIVLVCLFGAFFVLYKFGPDIPSQRSNYVWPGVGLWLAVSFGLRFYFVFFDSYSVTYGSLGAVIVLMLWFYFTGLAFLIGGEYNAVLESSSSPPSGRFPSRH